MTGGHDGGRDGESLASFLLARLAEDEEIARAALEGEGDHADTVHAARHDPERVLREVAAKRAVVELWLTGLLSRAVEYRDDGVEVAEQALVHLAAVYDDAPGQLPAPAAPQPGRLRGGPDNVVALDAAGRGRRRGRR